MHHDGVHQAPLALRRAESAAAIRCLSETRSSTHPLIGLLYVAMVRGHVLLPAVGALNQAVVLLDTLRELVEKHLHHGATARVGQSPP